MSLTYKNVSTLKCAVLTKNVTKMISINNNKHDLKKKKNQINSYGNYSENKETEHVHQSF